MTWTIGKNEKHNLEIELGKFELIKCDLIKYLKDKSNNLIVQCVNNQNIIGGGISGVINNEWPQVKTEYHKFMDKGNGLGDIQYVNCNNFKNQFVVNMVAQSIPGGHYFKTKSGGVHLPPVRYDSLKECMLKIAQDFMRKDLYTKGYSIVGPKFCCGLSQGSFDVVKGLINECWLANDIDVTICEL